MFFYKLVISLLLISYGIVALICYVRFKQMALQNLHAPSAKFKQKATLAALSKGCFMRPN